MEVNWRIFYRGSLNSCNYSCHYCPFAKKKNSRAELEDDKNSLYRFSHWVKERKENLSILFTPWGEALIRKYYQEVLTELSHYSHIKKIAIQTNASCPTSWMNAVNKARFSLWITYHPTEIPYDKFRDQLNRIIDLGINFSIGVVGKKEHIPYVEQLKNDFPDHYVWVNAYKDKSHYYNAEDIKQLNVLDEHFSINLKNYSSRGKKCQAGHTSFLVNHQGHVFPCHFIKKRIGNIYHDAIEQLLAPKRCSQNVCNCYIGYINLTELNLESIYGQDIIARIPKTK